MGAMMLAHAMATLCTNASISFVNAGAAFTIKSFEPVTTAALTSILLGVPLSSATVVALPLVVCGSAGFVAQPTIEPTGSFGLGLALISNVMYGVRNINIKLSHSSRSGEAQKLDDLWSMSAASVVALLAPAVLLLLAGTSVELDLFAVLSSGLCHVSYTIISTCVILKYMSVIGHATCNLLKRVCIALAFFFIGKQHITAGNWIMGAVFVVGLVIYVYPRAEGGNSKQENTSLVFTLVTIGVVCLMAVAAWQATTDPSAAPAAVPAVRAAPPPPTSLRKPLELERARAKRHSELGPLAGLSADDQRFLRDERVYERPSEANRLSNRLTTVDGVVQEARRLHDQLFEHLLGGYRRAVLVNVFLWFNKGDHLITIGQRKILERRGVDIVYACYYSGGGCDFSTVPRDADVVVLVQGAGYIGHPAHEYMLDLTVRSFPRNRVVMLPISVCHPTPPCVDIDQFALIAARHDDFHIVLRDLYSLEVAKQYFAAGVKLYLAPDSAWAVGRMQLDIVPVYDIIWLKRDDWESQGDPMPPMPQHLRTLQTDWSDGWMDQPADDFWERHQLKTLSGAAFLARARVVVSDRLHAHILSQLMGKPNVVINSQTRKQEHYYLTWERGVETSRLVSSNVEALRAALELLERFGGGSAGRYPPPPESPIA